MSDLAVANNFSNTVSILLGQGDGTFTSNTVRVTGQNVSATVGTSFSGPVASVIGAEQAADLSATINWGDGSAATTGTVTGTDPFIVSGNYTYSKVGTFPITITVTDNTTHQTSQGTTTAIVGTLTLTQFIVSPLGRHAAGLAATFTDTDTTKHWYDYQATVNWGDGVSSPVLVVKKPLGPGFLLAGLHVYVKTGTYTVTLTVIANANGSQLTKTATITVN